MRTTPIRSDGVETLIIRVPTKTPTSLALLKPVRRSRPLTLEERRSLIRVFTTRGSATCPECGRPMDRREVQPRDDVSYVRHRLWVTCPACDASAVLDVEGPS